MPDICMFVVPKYANPPDIRLIDPTLPCATGVVATPLRMLLGAGLSVIFALCL